MPCQKLMAERMPPAQRDQARKSAVAALGGHAVASADVGQVDESIDSLNRGREQAGSITDPTKKAETLQQLRINGILTAQGAEAARMRAAPARDDEGQRVTPPRSAVSGEDIKAIYNTTGPLSDDAENAMQSNGFWIN